MPSLTPQSLVLSEAQQQVLQEMGIDLDKIHIILGDVLHDIGVRINGYTNGHYVFFMEGNSNEHALFLRYLYGVEYRLSLPSRFRGITIYGGPTERFVNPETLVSVSTATINPISY